MINFILLIANVSKKTEILGSKLFQVFLNFRFYYISTCWFRVKHSNCKCKVISIQRLAYKKDLETDTTKVFPIFNILREKNG